ncbi:hypothetical protein [Enterovibrio norvegicus]|uniref:hypothetical protein n=1 Tax=Enterovibrio norvegicus TaxID=188144 RepID=UPI000C827D53|nr:hypothetical protein [Enterovibrio norvegicus]PMN70507.1 hypothetical protein BCT27_01980 [Enterovibrio norvegicus]
MEELRLEWEPKSKVSLDELEEKFQYYANDLKTSLSILKNGTVLFVKDSDNNELDAQKCMLEAKFLIDFRTVELKRGGWLVGLHNAVAVFVSESEYSSVKKEIIERQSELKFPKEEFIGGSGDLDEHLIGLYARGKLQYDAHNFAFYKRIEARGT